MSYFHSYSNIVVAWEAVHLNFNNACFLLHRDVYSKLVIAYNISCCYWGTEQLSRDLRRNRIFFSWVTSSAVSVTLYFLVLAILDYPLSRRVFYSCQSQRGKEPFSSLDLAGLTSSFLLLCKLYFTHVSIFRRLVCQSFLFKLNYLSVLFYSVLPSLSPFMPRLHSFTNFTLLSSLFLSSNRIKGKTCRDVFHKWWILRLGIRSRIGWNHPFVYRTSHCCHFKLPTRFVW